MTGKEYVELRQKFIKSAAWVLLQSTKAQRSDSDREQVIELMLASLGRELREEVETQITLRESA